MLWGPMFLGSLGEFVHYDNGAASLIRLVGVGFFLTGAVLVAVRNAELELQRRISAAMMGGHFLAGVIVMVQQTEIWESPLGMALTVWMFLSGCCFALVFTQRSKLRLAIS